MATDPTAELRAEVDRLVADAREGDRAAFDELVRRTYVDTYTLAMRLTANEEDARDVVQESYLRAWKGIKRFRGDAQFSTWMYRITANAAATLVQKRRRRRAESLDMVEEPIDTSIEGHPEAAAESAIVLEPSPSLPAQTLAAHEEAGERRAVRSLLSGRRLAYAGAIGGAALATAGTAAALILARSRRRTAVA